VLKLGEFVGSIGNQGMQIGNNPNFYNAPVSRKGKSQKLLVGSFNIDQQHKGISHPGIGNQAAPMNHLDIGTNIVFVSCPSPPLLPRP